MAQQRQVQCRHHLGSRVVIDTPLAGHDPPRETACSSEPLDALAAALRSQPRLRQADGTTSLALVRKSITSRKKVRRSEEASSAPPGQVERAFRIGGVPADP